MVIFQCRKSRSYAHFLHVMQYKVLRWHTNPQLSGMLAAKSVFCAPILMVQCGEVVHICKIYIFFLVGVQVLTKRIGIFYSFIIGREFLFHSLCSLSFPGGEGQWQVVNYLLVDMVRVPLKEMTFFLLEGGISAAFVQSHCLILAI